MTSRAIRTEGDLSQLVALLRARKRPFTVTIRAGKARSIDQNRLQRLWCSEAAEQLGDITPEYVRGYSKLHFGVPILRFEDEGFAAAYDARVKPLPYETKVALMMEPLDMPVTRLMNTGQKTRYLDAMAAHWQAQGVRLTMPEGVTA
jgi:hypothetical protein